MAAHPAYIQIVVVFSIMIIVNCGTCVSKEAVRYHANQYQVGNFIFHQEIRVSRERKRVVENDMDTRVIQEVMRTNV